MFGNTPGSSLVRIVANGRENSTLVELGSKKSLNMSRLQPLNTSIKAAEASSLDASKTHPNSEVLAQALSYFKHFKSLCGKLAGPC